MKTIMILVLFFCSTHFCCAQKGAVIRNVSVKEFQRGLDSSQDEILIDLRTPEELKQGKIANARVIDFFGPDFEPAIGKLNKDKVYFLYCASGARSGEAAALMEKMGFRKLYNLEGGFRKWVAEKMPVEKR